MTTRARETSIEGQTRELTRLMRRSIKGLKKQVTSCSAASVLDEALVADGLGPRHFPVLIHVAISAPIGVSALADQIGLSVATTSLLVGELSRSGYVVRTEDDEDRRRTLVTVHEDYSEVMDAWAYEALDPLRRTLKRLKPDARANFLKVMAVLAEECWSDPAGTVGT